jgi:hypothetical protein
MIGAQNERDPEGRPHGSWKWIYFLNGRKRSREGLYLNGTPFGIWIWKHQYIGGESAPYHKLYHLIIKRRN